MSEVTMVTIPMGTTVIETKELNFIRDERAMYHNTFSILKAKVIDEWVRCKKRNWSASIDCSDLAELLGFELPEVESEVTE